MKKTVIFDMSGKATEVALIPASLLHEVISGYKERVSYAEPRAILENHIHDLRMIQENSDHKDMIPAAIELNKSFEDRIHFINLVVHNDYGKLENTSSVDL